MSRDRPPVPEHIEREVRQRCGFGCVLCGNPLVVYHHIHGYKEAIGHNAEEITLLCSGCHDEYHDHLVAKDAILVADKNPFNLRSGVSAGYPLKFRGDQICVDLGTSKLWNTVSRESSALRIDGTTIIGFGFADGRALVDLRLFDETDRPILTIEANVLRYKANLWDVRLKANHLLVRKGLGKKTLSITFIPEENKIKIDRGKLRHRGIVLDIWPDCALLLNGQRILRGNTFTGPECLIALGEGALRGGGLCLPEISRDFDAKETQTWVDDIRRVGVENWVRQGRGG